MCVHACTCMSWNVYGGQRTTSRSLFSPSTFMQVPRLNSGHLACTASTPSCWTIFPAHTLFSETESLTMTWSSLSRPGMLANESWDLSISTSPAQGSHAKLFDVGVEDRIQALFLTGQVHYHWAIFSIDCALCSLGTVYLPGRFRREWSSSQ